MGPRSVISSWADQLQHVAQETAGIGLLAAYERPLTTMIEHNQLLSARMNGVQEVCGKQAAARCNFSITFPIQDRAGDLSTFLVASQIDGPLQ